MRSNKNLVRRAAPFVALSLLGMLAACSGGTTSPSASGVAMSDAEANAAGDVVANDVGAQTEGATSTSASSSFYTSTSGGGVSAYTSATVSARFRPWWLTGCTPAPTRVVVGTTATYTFSNCTLNRIVPLESVVRNGVVAVTADTGLRQVVFTGFKRDVTRLSLRTGKSESFSDTRDGTRQYLRNDGSSFAFNIYGATASDSFKTTYVGADSATGTHLRKWSSSFTADTAGTIAKDQPLPSGVFVVSGSSNYSRTKGDSTKTWSFQTQTGSTGLHFNSSCDATGLQFDAGSITSVVTNKAGATSTVNVTFTACGKYTVTKS